MQRFPLLSWVVFRGISSAAPTSIHPELRHTATVERNELSPTGPLRPSPNDEVPALVAALHQSHLDSEAERGELAGALHDDIGGLLLGAIMDMGWIANTTGLADTVKDKLAQAQGLMRAAIDITRELVENLKPTLLDNVGLYPALRWHMNACCMAASVPYTESFPAFEDAMTSDVRIGVFRIFQEALRDVLSQRIATGLSVRVEVTRDILHCHLIDRSDGRCGIAVHCASPEASMHLRARHVGGTLQWRRTSTGRHLHLQVPLTASAGRGFAE